MLKYMACTSQTRVVCASSEMGSVMIFVVLHFGENVNAKNSKFILRTIPFTHLSFLNCHIMFKRNALPFDGFLSLFQY